MNATHALGWALVHFLWQGAALAILLGVALALIRPTAARTRYAVALLTLAAMLVLPVATTVQLYEPAIPSSSKTADVTAPAPSPSLRPSVTSVTSPATVAAVTPSPSTARFTLLRDRLEPMLTWFVVIWVVGVLILSVRLAYGWLGARRLRTQGTRAVSEALQQVLARLAARLRVNRSVRLLESLLIEVPAVVGWLRPVVLVPASALTGLTPQQLEVLLAHELAHVRRYDYLVNIVQCVIETLLFYHPAVWWVSRRIREEREHCCDDLAVAVCGDPHFYATALVGMERIRSTAPPRLALAATGAGGSLLTRVRRLVLPSPARTEYFPRWAAGIAGMLAVTVGLLTTGSQRLAGKPTTDVTADTTRAAPDTVLRHPDPSQPFAQRWDWARAQARQLNRRLYWIGYTIKRPVWLEHAVYVDRGTEVVGENITISGRMYGNFQGFMFRGVRLGPLTGAGDSNDIALLFGFTDQSGKPVLTHVHVASAYLPVDFRGRSLLWLGSATDAQSLPIVQDLFAAASNPDLREDVVSALGIHGSSDVVVPLLVRLLTGREAVGVREQAAEWLGFHPSPAAVVALSTAARTDVSGDVRRRASEALGDNPLPAALDSSIAIARTAGDADARRAAIEGLGQKSDDRARTALVSIAQTDRDEDVERAAVEALGELSSGRGLPALREIARNHRSSDVRRSAVETLAEHLPPAEAIALLESIATNDSNADVQRTAVEKLGELAPTAEAVRFLSTLLSNSRSEDVQRQALETLGELGGPGLPVVIDVARSHPSAELRRAAIETIGDKAPAQALDILGPIARRDRDSDVQQKAIETLGDLKDERAYSLLVDVARTNPSSDVRRKAIETLGESGHPDSVLAVLTDLARRSNDPEAAQEAIETLGDMKDARAVAIIARVARTSDQLDVRRKALETYVDAASSDSALALLKSILASNAPEDVNTKVLETLEEMDGGAGIPLLIETARSHPNRDVRADALRRLAESDDPRAQKVFDQTLRRP